MPDGEDIERRLAALEARCKDLEAALATIVDAIAGQVDIQAETARNIETLMQEVLRLRGGGEPGAAQGSRLSKSDLHSIPGGKTRPGEPKA